MDKLKDEIREKLKENRPNLSVSSIKTYLSILSSLYKKIDGKDNLVFFSEKHEDILKHLESINDQTKKSILSALFVLTGKVEYKELMDSLIKKVNEEYKNQTMNEKQKDNWIDVSEIKQKYDALFLLAQKMLSKKIIMNENVLIDFLLMFFLSGSVIPPRRSMDYSELKIRNYDKKKDNFYEKGKFYFNKYKTAKTYGEQVIESIPKEIDTLIKKWIKINTTDFMLYGKTKQKMSCPQITRALNKIFGKNISTNLLRHIYLSNIYKDMPALQNIQDLAIKMGHSSETAMEYIKR